MIPLFPVLLLQLSDRVITVLHHINTQQLDNRSECTLFPCNRQVFLYFSHHFLIFFLFFLFFLSEMKGGVLLFPFFFFLHARLERKEETQGRKAARGDATPLGGKRRRESARRPCGFAIRRQKRFDLFNADLKSASSENAQRRHEKPAAADCKSAIKRSSLFCLRITNPQERLTDSNFSLTPSGLEFLLNALRTRVSP